jgi:16S rRNA (guanine527-N7)-methyltransferase
VARFRPPPQSLPIAFEGQSASGVLEPEARQVREALARAGVTEDRERAAALLLRHAALVREWNRRGNLVSRGDAARIVERHVVESLEAAPTVRRLVPRTILDLGSGGGFPGVPLAILHPRTPVVLLESRRLRALFLLRVTRELELPMAFAWCARAEALAGRVDPGSSGLEPGSWSRHTTDPPAHFAPFDLMTARAVSALLDLARAAAPLVCSGGHLLAFKGSRADEEVAAWGRDPGPWRLVSDERAPSGMRLLLLKRSSDNVSRETMPARPS